MAHRNLGLDSMKRICVDLSDIAKVESEPKMMGRRATMVLAPDKNAAAKSAAEKPKQGSDKETAPPQAEAG